MLVTTTSNIEGQTIKDYKGLVLGDFIIDISASKDFEAELRNARQEATGGMIQTAQGLGANAVVGAKFDYETLGGGGTLMVTISGTAVVAE